MSPICSSILFQLLLALLCEAYPAPDYKEMSVENFARFLDRYEKLMSDNSRVDLEVRESPDVAKEVWNRDGTTTNNETPNDLRSDYAFVDKRGLPKGKYHYYKCYFNPVTCYGK